MSGGFVGKNGNTYGTVGTLWRSFFHSIDNQTIIYFIKETIFFINCTCDVCYL